MSHPISDRTLYRFASGTASREEGRAVLAHLLQGCAPCSRTLSVVSGFAKPAAAHGPAASGRPPLRRPATLQ